MDFFFSKVPVCDFSKKGLHQRFFSVVFVKCFTNFFSSNKFGWKFLFSKLLWAFSTVFKIVVVFAIFWRLPLWSPTKIIITWFTKQIKTLYLTVAQTCFMKLLSRKRIETFLGKCPWCSPISIKSQSNVIEAGLWHWHFTQIFLTFYSEDPFCRVYANFSSDL